MGGAVKLLNADSLAYSWLTARMHGVWQPPVASEDVGSLSSPTARPERPLAPGQRIERSRRGRPSEPVRAPRAFADRSDSISCAPRRSACIWGCRVQSGSIIPRTAGRGTSERLGAAMSGPLICMAAMRTSSKSWGNASTPPSVSSGRSHHGGRSEASEGQGSTRVACLEPRSAQAGRLGTRRPPRYGPSVPDQGRHPRRGFGRQRLPEPVPARNPTVHSLDAAAHDQLTMRRFRAKCDSKD